MKRNLEMSPNSNDNAQLLNLINKIQTILDNLVVSPGEFDACVCAYFYKFFERMKNLISFNLAHR